MRIDKFTADIQARTGVSKVVQALLGISMMTNLLGAAIFLAQDHTVRTVLTPPNITKAFWVDGKALGPEYLEQMGIWVVQQYASFTPTSIDQQNNLLLKYVHPSIHGDLAIKFKIASQKVKADSVSRYFFPREVRISEKGNAVVFIGQQDMWIADKKVPESKAKAFLVSFQYDGQNTTIKELRETDPRNPFAPVSQEVLNQQTVSDDRSAGVNNQMQAEQADSTVNAKPQNVSTLPPAPAAPNPAQEAIASGQASISSR